MHDFDFMFFRPLPRLFRPGTIARRSTSTNTLDVYSVDSSATAWARRSILILRIQRKMIHSTMTYKHSSIIYKQTRSFLDLPPEEIIVPRKVFFMVRVFHSNPSACGATVNVFSLTFNARYDSFLQPVPLSGSPDTDLFSHLFKMVIRMSN